MKNYKDDIKSIERARRELIKIDKQLQVILFETDAVRSEHRQLMEEYKVTIIIIIIIIYNITII